MRYINGCRVVHGGIIIDTGVPEMPRVEINSHTFHNPNYDIVNYYYYDNELDAKICLTLCRNIHTGGYVSEVYFFKSREELHFYRSKVYKVGYDKIPKKYIPLLNKMKEIHDKINFNQYNKI